MTFPVGHWTMIEHYRVETPYGVPEATWYVLKMIQGVALYETANLTEMRDYATSAGFTYGTDLFQALIDMSESVHGLYDPDNITDLGSSDDGITFLRPRNVYIGTAVLIGTGLGESGVLYLGNQAGSKPRISGDGITGNLDLYAAVGAEITAHSQISGLYPDEQHHLATKQYVDQVAQGLDWQNSVLSFWDASIGLPVSPVIGARYICEVAGNGWNLDSIYEWSTINHVNQWIEDAPNDGFATLVENEGIQYMYNGAAWVQFSSLFDHHKLQNLAAYDDHTQYLPVDGSRPMVGNLYWIVDGTSDIGTDGDFRPNRIFIKSSVNIGTSSGEGGYLYLGDSTCNSSISASSDGTLSFSSPTADLFMLPKLNGRINMLLGPSMYIGSSTIPGYDNDIFLGTRDSALYWKFVTDGGDATNDNQIQIFVPGQPLATGNDNLTIGYDQTSMHNVVRSLVRQLDIVSSALSFEADYLQFQANTGDITLRSLAGDVILWPFSPTKQIKAMGDLNMGGWNIIDCESVGGSEFAGELVIKPSGQTSSPFALTSSTALDNPRQYFITALDVGTDSHGSSNRNTEFYISDGPNSHNLYFELDHGANYIGLWLDNASAALYAYPHLELDSASVVMSTDNDKDFGSIDAGVTMQRPRTVYVGTSVQIGTNPGESGTLILGEGRSTVSGDSSGTLSFKTNTDYTRFNKSSSEFLDIVYLNAVNNHDVEFRNLYDGLDESGLSVTFGPNGEFAALYITKNYIQACKDLIFNSDTNDIGWLNVGAGTSGRPGRIFTKTSIHVGTEATETGTLYLGFGGSVLTGDDFGIVTVQSATGRAVIVKDASNIGLLQIGSSVQLSGPANGQLLVLSQGFGIPMLSTVNRDLIAGPIGGLSVWNTDTYTLDVYDDHPIVQATGQIQDITYTAVASGITGNGIHINYQEQVLPMSIVVNSPMSVTVFFAGGLLTAQQIHDAWIATPAAMAIATPVITGVPGNFQSTGYTVSFYGGISPQWGIANSSVLVPYVGVNRNIIWQDDNIVNIGSPTQRPHRIYAAESIYIGNNPIGTGSVHMGAEGSYISGEGDGTLRLQSTNADIFLETQIDGRINLFDNTAFSYVYLTASSIASEFTFGNVGTDAYWKFIAETGTLSHDNIVEIFAPGTADSLALGYSQALGHYILGSATSNYDFEITAPAQNLLINGRAVNIQNLVYTTFGTNTANTTPAVIGSITVPTGSVAHIEIRTVAKGSPTGPGAITGATFVTRLRAVNDSGAVALYDQTSEESKDQPGWLVSTSPSGTDVMITVQGVAGYNIAWDATAITKMV